MNIIIREINDEDFEILAVKDFLYYQIKKEYGIGPMPEFHYDIEGLKEYYVLPERSTMYIALDGDSIVATAAIRGYDKDYEFFKDVYSKDDTGSIWRLFVDEKYRRKGLARKLLEAIEKFARNEGYKRIYLNTHRYLEAAIPFWKSIGYEITVEEDDYDETTHMIKNLV